MPLLRFGAMASGPRERCIAQLVSEIEYLKTFRHWNLVSYLGVARKDDTLNILQEYVPGQTLEMFIKNKMTL